MIQQYGFYLIVNQLIIQILNEFYSKYRILITDVNTNNDYRIAISGFEIYGETRGNTWMLNKIELENKGREFKHSGDFDKNGIIYHIATHNNTKPWSNPGKRGEIKATFSSLMDDSEPEYSIFGKEAVLCGTKSETDSYIIIDFFPRMIKPTDYSIKHYCAWNNALRNWEFSGSSDNGKTWTPHL